MDVKSLIFEVRLTKKRPFILSIAIHGFGIPAIPAGMTLFRICVDTHALSREKHSKPQRLSQYSATKYNTDFPQFLKH
jgi:hypothetical protein